LLLSAFALALPRALAGTAAGAAEVRFGIAVPSPALGHEIPYVLYEPAPAPAPGERWPELYLLHGLGDDERAWVTLGRAAETLDRLIAEGKLKSVSETLGFL
jgi:hypothetical protein